jgi:dTDP-4-amino-4,6-dideoxygalactose transaminase
MADIIPCLDLKRQQQTVKKDIFSLFEEVYDQTAFSGGPFVERFEKDFSSFIGTTHAIGLDNGTSALHLALLSLGVGPGDEVIIPANTFIATAWGVSYTGATPVFADCDALTWEIDPADVERKITKKTKAIIGVHLYGMPFDVDAVNAIAKKHGLFLLEDAAQAQGAKYKGMNAGTFGALACFSFYPGKNLGACGEAGGISTNNASYAEHIRSLRNHGCKVRYLHDEIGFNMRMGGLEAASLIIKLRHLSDWNAHRQAIAKRYVSEIQNKKITMQKQPDWATSIYHLFVVTCEEKDAFVKHLQNNSISPAFHYPVPCHLQKAYAHLGYKTGSFPNAEYLAAHCISLPMFAELTNEEVDRVVHAVNSFK